MTFQKMNPALVARWSVEVNPLTTEKLLKKLELTSLENINESPFGLVNGLVDLRGFPFHLSPKIKNKDFEGVDLSGSSFRGVWLEGCNFKSIKFDHSNLAQLKDHRNQFENCSFLKASFTSAGLGYRSSSYTQCFFEETDFRKTVFIAARFNSCRFSRAKLKGIDFYASSFDECVFLGRMEDVWFRGCYPSPRDENEFGAARKNMMRKVSFADAELIGVNFTGGCDLSSIILPAYGEYRRYENWRDRLAKLAEVSSKWPVNEQKEAQIFIRSYLESAEQQSSMLINVSEISNEFGVALSSKIFDGLES